MHGPLPDLDAPDCRAHRTSLDRYSLPSLGPSLHLSLPTCEGGNHESEITTGMVRDFS